jgi:hypothetical protein
LNDFRRGQSGCNHGSPPGRTAAEGIIPLIPVVKRGSD